MATGGSIPAAAPQAPIYTQGMVPQTVIVQHNSGFSSSPFLWFMLGHSMSDHRSERVVYDHTAYPAATPITDPTTGALINPEANDSAPAATSWEPQQSFGEKLLRVMLWLLIIAVALKGVSYLLWMRAARMAAHKSNYSLGKQ